MYNTAATLTLSHPQTHVNCLCFFCSHFSLAFPPVKRSTGDTSQPSRCMMLILFLALQVAHHTCNIPRGEIYVYIYTYMGIYIYVYLHIYIYIYRYRYKYMHTLLRACYVRKHLLLRRLLPPVVALILFLHSAQVACTHGMEEGGGTAVLQPGGGGGDGGGDKPPGDEDPNWWKSLLASIPCA